MAKDEDLTPQQMRKRQFNRMERDQQRTVKQQRREEGNYTQTTLNWKSDRPEKMQGKGESKGGGRGKGEGGGKGKGKGGRGERAGKGAVKQEGDSKRIRAS